jgi:hypothetical protein
MKSKKRYHQEVPDFQQSADAGLECHPYIAALLGVHHLFVGNFQLPKGLEVQHVLACPVCNRLQTLQPVS